MADVTVFFCAPRIQISHIKFRSGSIRLTKEKIGVGYIESSKMTFLFSTVDTTTNGNLT